MCFFKEVENELHKIKSLVWQISTLKFVIANWKET